MILKFFWTYENKNWTYILPNMMHFGTSCLLTLKKSILLLMIDGTPIFYTCLLLFRCTIWGILSKNDLAKASRNTGNWVSIIGVATASILAEKSIQHSSFASYWQIWPQIWCTSSTVETVSPWFTVYKHYSEVHQRVQCQVSWCSNVCLCWWQGNHTYWWAWTFGL